MRRGMIGDSQVQSEGATGLIFIILRERAGWTVPRIIEQARKGVCPQGD